MIAIVIIIIVIERPVIGPTFKRRVILSPGATIIIEIIVTIVVMCIRLPAVGAPIIVLLGVPLLRDYFRNYCGKLRD